MNKKAIGVRFLPTVEVTKDYRFIPIDDERIGDDNPIGGPVNLGLSGPNTGLEVSDIRGSSERIIQMVKEALAPTELHPQYNRDYGLENSPTRTRNRTNDTNTEYPTGLKRRDPSRSGEDFVRNDYSDPDGRLFPSKDENRYHQEKNDPDYNNLKNNSHPHNRDQTRNFF